MKIFITKEKRNIGVVEDDRFSTGLLVKFYEGEEPNEIQLRALFGTAEIQILEKTDGVGCYEKVKRCIVLGWELFI